MKLAAFVFALAIPVSAQDQAREGIEAKLKNLKVTLDFQDAPIDSVVDYLREISDLNIVIDAKVRDKDIKVRLKVNDVSLRAALHLILKPHDCDTWVKDGVLRITTRGDIQDQTLRTEIYDCRDILMPIIDFPGVDFALEERIGTVVDGGAARETSEVPIEEWVRAHTGGKSWDENPKASCRLQNGLLIVKQTPEIHREVLRLLDLLRRNK